MKRNETGRHTETASREELWESLTNVIDQLNRLDDPEEDVEETIRKMCKSDQRKYFTSLKTADREGYLLVSTEELREYIIEKNRREDSFKYTTLRLLRDSLERELEDRSLEERSLPDTGRKVDIFS